jgi:two-component system, NarL family, nitrate/nitrite response regulator NarL
VADRGSVAVLVADDHPMFRLGLAMALRSLGFGRVDEAAHGEEAITLMKAHDYNVLVLDLRMPRLNGLAVAQHVSKGEPPRPFVILLTTYDEPAVVKAARDVGVAALLGKETEPERLAHVMDRLVDGAGLPVRRGTDLPHLTSRELEVLRELQTGGSLKDAARSLGISVETVKDHVASLYAKLDVRDRVSALKRAREYGWFLLDELDK